MVLENFKYSPLAVFMKRPHRSWGFFIRLFISPFITGVPAGGRYIPPNLTKMANEQNLKPIRKGDLSKEELKKRQSNGGKKSADARREKKLIRERILEKMGESDWDEMIEGVIKRAKKSDKAFEILRDTIGEKPSEKVSVTGSSEKFAEVISMWEQNRK